MIRSLEGLRGVAALIVALYHLKIGADYFSVIRHGYLYVDLFFVLSGFVITATYGARITSIEHVRTFLLRRIGRLFPLLIFSTAAFVVGTNAIVLAKRIALEHGYGSALNNPDALNYMVPNFMEVLSTVTFTHGMGVFDDLILNTPSWTISVEFYTYLLFAALCVLLRGKARIAALAIFAVAGMLISVWASTTLHHCLLEKGCLSLTYDFGFPRCVYSFSLGALTYYFSRSTEQLLHWQWISLATLAVVMQMLDALPALAFVLPVVFSAIILSICRDTGFFARVLKADFCQLLGQRSYSIYLMHMPLLLFFENISKRVSGATLSMIVIAAYVAVLIILSGWTYRFIEAPCRAWFNRMVSGAAVPAGQTNL